MHFYSKHFNSTQSNLLRILFFYFCIAAFTLLTPDCGKTQSPSAVKSAPSQSTTPEDTPTLAELRAQLEALEKRIAEGKAPADPQNLALLRFKLDQSELWLKHLESNDVSYLLVTPYEETRETLKKTLTRAAIIARANGDAVFPAVGQMHERAYISPADNSAQPYWVFVPRDYTPRRQYPLVVFLHGYDPYISKIHPWLPGEETWSLATDRNYIFAVPYGRRNSDFVGIGEDDTLAVTEAVKKRYSVDASKVFLLGPSMGGYGAYAVGLHNPHVWAGVTPMCGRTDFYLWFKLNRAALPSWKQVLYDGDDPRHLKLNALHLPFFFQHGARDQIVDVNHSRRFFADLKALGYAARYREIPDADHFIYWRASSYEIALDWMHSVRQAAPPKHVRYSTGALRNNQAYWVWIDGFEDYSRLAHIEAEIKPDNVIEVKTQNVTRFTLQPPAQYLQADAPVTLMVNGNIQKEKFEAVT